MLSKWMGFRKGEISHTIWSSTPVVLLCKTIDTCPRASHKERYEFNNGESRRCDRYPLPSNSKNPLVRRASSNKKRSSWFKRWGTFRDPVPFFLAGFPHEIRSTSFRVGRHTCLSIFASQNSPPRRRCCIVFLLLVVLFLFLIFPPAVFAVAVAGACWRIVVANRLVDVDNDDAR